MKPAMEAPESEAPGMEDGIETTLPTVYIADSGERIVDAAYRLTADCYLDDTLWIEGEVIVTHITPNPSMEPLNAAAEIALHDWLVSLPVRGSDLRLDEIVEAANMLRKSAPEMDHAQFSGAMIELAMRLKQKRSAEMQIPKPAGTVRSTTPAKAAPMPNARFTDGRTNMGGAVEPTVIHQPQRRENVVRRTAPAVGSLPPSGPNQQPAS